MWFTLMNKGRLTKGIMLDSSNEQDQCHPPLPDIVMSVASQTESETEEEEDRPDENSTPKGGDADGVSGQAVQLRGPRQQAHMSTRVPELADRHSS